jgi:hypothetical protein
LARIPWKFEGFQPYQPCPDAEIRIKSVSRRQGHGPSERSGILSRPVAVTQICPGRKFRSLPESRVRSRSR